METAADLVPIPAEQRHFGRYHLLYRIGIGGMASLYLARFVGPDGFEKLVAIKRIHEHLSAQPSFLKMFKDEARLAARISHPNVAHVIELGEHRGSYYIAMEYVNGENLSAVLGRTRLEPPIVARIFADALGGLHAAHELRTVSGELVDLVHRDLSPSNILVGYDGAVKVVDFGVARARGSLHVTEAGTVKGKFAYMSPEQVTNTPLDRRSDIFSVGILLYEASTRTRLFRADSDAGTVAMIQSRQVPPPASRVPGYPAALQQIVMRALEYDRERRFSTARQMEAALEAYIFSLGSPVTASSVGDMMQSLFRDRVTLKEQLLARSLMPAQAAVPAHAAASAHAAMPVHAAASAHAAMPVHAAAPAHAAVPAHGAVPAHAAVSAPRVDDGNGGAQPSGRRPTLRSEVSVVELEAGAPDEIIDIPAFVPPRPSATSQGLRAVEEPSDARDLSVREDLASIRSPMLRWGLLGAVLLVVGGVVALLSLRHGARPAVAPPPEQVEVTVLVRPLQARVSLEGRPADNPCRLRRPPGSSAATLEISAAGFRSQQLQVGFERSRSLEVQLQPLPAAAAPAASATALAPDRAGPTRHLMKRAAPLVRTKRPAHPRPRPGRKGLFGNPYED